MDANRKTFAVSKVIRDLTVLMLIFVVMMFHLDTVATFPRLCSIAAARFKVLYHLSPLAPPVATSRRALVTCVI